MQGSTNRSKLIFAGVLIAALLAVGVIVAVSGGGDGSGESGTSSISADLSTKPEVPAPSGAAPNQLEVNDVVAGDGATAAAGDSVSVQYVGVDYVTGQEFDSSWSRNAEPFDFMLGAGRVIPGWDQGVAGMKVGGRRELTIPPDLAYGPQGSPPAIGPDATLVFVIDLLDVTPGGGAPGAGGGGGGSGSGG